MMNALFRNPTTPVLLLAISTFFFADRPSLAAASVSGAAPMFRPALARLELDRRQVLPGQTLQATYTFRSSGPSPTEMTVFVHVVRPDGRHLGADFEPVRAATEWPTNGFVQEGPFPIAVPPDAAAGRYQIWVDMFPPEGGDRVELDNKDRQRGHRDYHVGEFEVLPTGGASVGERAMFDWLSVDQARIVKAPEFPVPPGAQGLTGLPLSVDRKVLNPLREPSATAKLTLTGRSVDLYRVTSDGRVPLSRSVPVKHATLVLSLEEGECLSILPTGARISDRARPHPEAVRGGY
jgi:hypothetical protein